MECATPNAKLYHVLPRCCPGLLLCQASKNRAKILFKYQLVDGAPEEIRTPDPQIRRLSLPFEIMREF